MEKPQASNDEYQPLAGPVPGRNLHPDIQQIVLAAGNHKVMNVSVTQEDVSAIFKIQNKAVDSLDPAIWKMYIDARLI